MRQARMLESLTEVKLDEAIINWVGHDLLNLKFQVRMNGPPSGRFDAPN